MLYYQSTKIITAREIPAGGAYYKLVDSPDYFKGYDWVAVQVFWDSINLFDGLITFCEKLTNKTPLWCTVPNQNCPILTASGSHIFQDVDLAAFEAALHINRGSARLGNFTWEVMARKQYPGDDICARLDKINETLKRR